MEQTVLLIIGESAYLYQLKDELISNHFDVEIFKDGITLSLKRYSKTLKIVIVDNTFPIDEFDVMINNIKSYFVNPNVIFVGHKSKREFIKENPSALYVKKSEIQELTNLVKKLAN